MKSDLYECVENSCDNVNSFMVSLEKCNVFEDKLKFIIKKNENNGEDIVFAGASLYLSDSFHPVDDFLKYNAIDFSKISRSLEKKWVISDFFLNSHVKENQSATYLVLEIIKFALEKKIDTLFFKLDYDLFDLFFSLGIPLELVCPKRDVFQREKKQTRFSVVIGKLGLTLAILRLLERKLVEEQNGNAY